VRPERPSHDRRGTRQHHSNETAGGRRRNLSQNFLADPRAASSFVDACELYPGDHVVEVGAGAGSLTGLIAARVATVTAYEPDVHLAERLGSSIAGLANVSIVHADVLAEPLPTGFSTLVGNIPFGRTADIIRWTLDQDVDSATYITQLEYARKRTGHRGRWSQLTIETWPWVRWALGPRISRTAFRPVPAVDAAVLLMRFRAEPLLSARQRATYRDIVATGFTGVGGTLFRSLQARYRTGQLTSAFGRAGLDREVVVAFVPPEAWLVLAEELTGEPAGGRPATGRRPDRSRTGPGRLRK